MKPSSLILATAAFSAALFFTGCGKSDVSSEAEVGADAEAAAATPSPTAVVPQAKWLIDFEKAKAMAAAENKPMLLDFTGSDWCGWCIKLKDEVFTKEAFKAYASESLVLVELDFPNAIPQNPEITAQNEALAEKYGIRGFPTIILLSPEGEVIGKTGYQQGGPENYVSHLKELLGQS